MQTINSKSCWLYILCRWRCKTKSL